MESTLPVPSPPQQRPSRRARSPLPRPLEAVLAASLPALLAGFHLAGLLYFLNPHLALSLRGFAEGSARIGLVLLPLSLALMLD